LLHGFWFSFLHEIRGFEYSFNKAFEGVVVTEHLLPQFDESLGEFEAHFVEVVFLQLRDDRINGGHDRRGPRVISD